MGRKLVIDASIYREPASGVHLAVRNGVLAEVPFLQASFQSLLIASFPPVPEVECMPLPTWAGTAVGRIFWQQCYLPRLLKKHEADLLHAEAYTMPLNCSLPVLLNVHDIIALEYPQWCSFQNVCHMRALLPGSIRRAAKCLVPTRHVAQRLQAVLGVPFRKIEIVPWGVDYQRFSTVSQLLEFELPENYFLFVGNLEPKKNLEFLLKAYADSAQQCQCALVIIGRAGWKCTSLQQTLRNWSGPGQVRWLGRVPDPVVTAVYQKAKALIMPSLEEGFGLPILEAMASGIPVLHSNHPALVEVAAGAGLAFSPYDSNELADLMKNIAGNSALREELRQAGQQRAQKATWNNWGRQSANILQNM